MEAIIAAIFVWLGGYALVYAFGRFLGRKKER